MFSLHTKNEKKKHRLLSLLIACSFAFSNVGGIIPTAVAYANDGDVTASQTEPSTANFASATGEMDDDSMKTDFDREIEQKINGTLGEMNSSNMDGLQSSDDPNSLSNINSNTRISVQTSDDLLTENQRRYEKAQKQQQENKTTTEAIETYMVTNSKNESVTVRKNQCYAKQTQECTQIRSFPYYNSDGTYAGTNTYALNQVEWLADNGEQVTASMAAQAKNYERVMNSTMGATSLSEIQQAGAQAALQAVTNLPSDATASDKARLFFMNQMATAQNQMVMEQDKKFDEALEKLNEAREKATFDRVDEEQEKRGTIVQDNNGKKRYKVRLNPPIPTLNDGQDITATLKTSTNKPNDESKYTIRVRAHNYKTGKDEVFQVMENTPFVLEPRTWERKPGTRTVVVQYKFSNSKEVETSTFQYTVGQMQTSILPNGMAVNNSVNALVANVGITNYTKESSQVAGRVMEAEYIDGVCSMRLTDSKVDDDPNYAPAIITTTKLDASTCNNLAGKYVAMGKVISDLDDSGNYVWKDVSDSSESNFAMTESEYDALESKMAEAVKEESKKFDIPTMTVDPVTGEIYSALPGELGVNYVYFQGIGKSVSVYKDSDGSYRFAKADGTEYSETEKANLGIDLGNYSLGEDENGKVYAYETSSGKLATGAFNDKALLELSQNTTTIFSQNPTALNFESSTYGSAGSSVFSVNGIANHISNGAKAVYRGFGAISSLTANHIGTSLSSATKTSPMENNREEYVSKVLMDECTLNLSPSQCARLAKGIADGTY